MKLQKQNKNGTFTISLPIQILRAYGWKHGDDLGYKIEKQGTLTLYKK